MELCAGETRAGNAGAKEAGGKWKKSGEQLRESERFAAIRRDLLDQLARNGTVGEHYVSLVDDYMDYWVDKCLLAEDIRKRGVVVTYNNGGGQKGRKKNDSITDKIKVTGQMLTILSALGLKPTEAEGGAGDDDL